MFNLVTLFEQSTPISTTFNTWYHKPVLLAQEKQYNSYVQLISAVYVIVGAINKKENVLFNNSVNIFYTQWLVHV